MHGVDTIWTSHPIPSSKKFRKGDSDDDSNPMSRAPGFTRAWDSEDGRDRGRWIDLGPEGLFDRDIICCANYVSGGVIEYE